MRYCWLEHGMPWILQPEARIIIIDLVDERLRTLNFVEYLVDPALFQLNLLDVSAGLDQPGPSSKSKHSEVLAVQFDSACSTLALHSSESSIPLDQQNLHSRYLWHEPEDGPNSVPGLVWDPIVPVVLQVILLLSAPYCQSVKHSSMVSSPKLSSTSFGVCPRLLRRKG